MSENYGPMYPGITVICRDKPEDYKQGIPSRDNMTETERMGQKVGK